MSGRTLKDVNLKSIEDFLPDYLQDRKVVIEKSLMEQRKDMNDFKVKLLAAQEEAGRR
jgi:predicted component of type VI protein secretion system